MSLKKPMWPSVDQAFLFMIIVSFGIGYPFFESRIGGKSVALTDIVVLAYLPVFLFRFTQIRTRNFELNFWIGPMVLLLAFLVVLLIHLPGDGWISVAGWCRPTLVFIIISVLLTRGYSDGMQTIWVAFACLLFVSVSSGVIGFISYWIWDTGNPFIMIRPYYLGLIPVQLSALDGHPNGAAQILFLGLWVGLFRPASQSKQPLWMNGLGWMAILSTLSKSILIYVALYMRHITGKARWAMVATSLLVGSYLIFSHFFPLKTAISKRIQHDLYVIPSAPLCSIGPYTFYQTTYTANKIAAWSAFTSSPAIGLGPRNYIPYVQQLQAEGKYPLSSKFFNSHCTYTSILARFGSIGFIGLICYALFLIKNIRCIQDPLFKTMFIGIFSMYALDGLTSDLEYQRAFWFFNAWLAAHLSSQSAFSDHQV